LPRVFSHSFKPYTYMNKQSMKRRLFVDCRIEGTSDDVNDDVEWEDSVREAFQVLQEYTLLGDPMQTLQHYYQKKGHIESISTSWQPPRYYRVGKGKDSSTYWRCTFTCPLDPSMKGSSVIATALLRNQEPSTVVEGTILQLEELSKQWFGDFLISPHDNHVYFGTKKNAKRSAAFGFLWDVFGTSGVKEQLLAPSSKSIITTTKVFAPTRIHTWMDSFAASSPASQSNLNSIHNALSYDQKRPPTISKACARPITTGT